MAKRSHSVASRSKNPGGLEHANGTKAPATSVVWAPPKAVTTPVPLAPDAIAQFERAMQAMQRHQYAAAADHFRRLLQQFPSERALLDRARTYAALCERETKRAPAAPVTVEERLTAATAALNDGDNDRAEALAEAVLGERPDHDLALYLLAVVHARRGATDAALGWLGRALDISPDVTAQARHDADFEPLRDLEAFQQLLESTTAAQSGTRRSQQARSER